MRESNYIALYSDSFLLKRTLLETSIETVEKSKYKATYSLISHTDNHLVSSKKLSTFKEKEDRVETLTFEKRYHHYNNRGIKNCIE